MSTTLLTGGAGLVGSNVARMLAARGDDVRLTVRDRSDLSNLDFEYHKVRCDILDRAAVKRAMKGVQCLYHVAGLTSLRASTETLFKVNVQGTRNVLEEALRAGVERVVFTSSVAAVGPAPRGGTADETQLFTAGSLRIPYVNSKHEAEREALRLAARGLPVVIVNPAFVLGRGGVNRSSTDLVRRFMAREIPAYVDGAVNIVDVQDVARGHLLAEERGTVGERYILGNRNYTLDRLFADLGRLSEIEPPPIKVPLSIGLAIARLAQAAPGRSVVTPVEVQAGSLWWTYRSNKAKRELGYRPSPHEDALVATIEWYREREDRLSPRGARQPLALRATGFAMRQASGVLRGVGI